MGYSPQGHKRVRHDLPTKQQQEHPVCGGFFLPVTASVTEDPRPLSSPFLQLNLLLPPLCVHAKLLQSCRTICNPMNCSPVARLLCPWGFSRQEYWSGLPCSPPGHLPDPGIELTSLMSPAFSGKVFTLVPLGKPLSIISTARISVANYYLQFLLSVLV